MGSFLRVRVHYCDLEEVIVKNAPVYGAVLNGENIYKSKLENGLIIIGNEANGISKTIEEITKNRLSIPRFGDLQQAESLNVATATGIILSEFKRNLA